MFVLYEEDPYEYKKATHLFLFEDHLGSYVPIDKLSRSTGMQFSRYSQG